MCADRATHKVTAQNPRNSAVTVTLCPWTLSSAHSHHFQNHHVFHSISIPLLLGTFCPFSSPQSTAPLPPEPRKYPLATSLTVPANSPLSYPHAHPVQLSLQLTAPGIHQHLVCSVKTAAHQGSNWQTLSGMIEPTVIHTAPYTQLCLEQFHHWYLFTCSSRGV